MHSETDLNFVYVEVLDVDNSEVKQTDESIFNSIKIEKAIDIFNEPIVNDRIALSDNYIINNVWKGNGQPFLDLYVGTIGDNGELKDVQKFSNIVNTKFHEADVTFTRDRKTVYFTRSNYFERKYKKDSLGINRLKIFKATQDTSGEWSIISDLPFNKASVCAKKLDNNLT